MEQGSEPHITQLTHFICVTSHSSQDWTDMLRWTYEEAYDRAPTTSQMDKALELVLPDRVRASA